MPPSPCSGNNAAYSAAMADAPRDNIASAAMAKERTLARWSWICPVKMSSSGL